MLEVEPSVAVRLPEVAEIGQGHIATHAAVRVIPRWSILAPTFVCLNDWRSVVLWAWQFFEYLLNNA